MISVVVSLLLTLRGCLRSRATLHVELLALRHQLLVLERSRRGRLRLRHADRLLWVSMSRLWTHWRSALVIVKPETVIAWHRRGFRRFWTWKSRRRHGRPTVPPDVRTLIRTVSEANPRWGAPRIHGELLKLGIDVSQTTVAKYMVARRQPPSQTWRTFLANHLGQIAAADFFVVQNCDVPTLVRPGDFGPRAPSCGPRGRDLTSDRGVDGTTAARSVPLGPRTAISGPGSRSRVRRHGDHRRRDANPPSAHGTAFLSLLKTPFLWPLLMLRATVGTLLANDVRLHRFPSDPQKLCPITRHPPARGARVASPVAGAGAVTSPAPASHSGGPPVVGMDLAPSGRTGAARL
jgi:hypothetical protein